MRQLHVHVIDHRPRGRELRLFFPREDGSLHRIGTLSVSYGDANDVLAVLRAGGAAMGATVRISFNRGASYHQSTVIPPRGD